ncbi:hypothetical protein HDE_07763 [Halotydeus destructor]|nr:hypothetical protein HDE_07763 [Halotydeus destructor]
MCDRANKRETVIETNLIPKMSTLLLTLVIVGMVSMVTGQLGMGFGSLAKKVKGSSSSSGGDWFSKSENSKDLGPTSCEGGKEDVDKCRKSCEADRDCGATSSMGSCDDTCYLVCKYVRVIKEGNMGNCKANLMAHIHHFRDFGGEGKASIKPTKVGTVKVNPTTSASGAAAMEGLKNVGNIGSDKAGGGGLGGGALSPSALAGLGRK